MSKQYLDKTGLSYFWGKIKAYVDAHGGNVDSTPVPTAGKVAEFDSHAHMNSTDMSAQEVSDFVDSLQVGGGNVAVDLVVEEGISGIWTYRKWSSGIAECWGTTAGASHAITSPYGYGYWVHENYTLPSGLFTSVTSAQANRSGGDGLVYISIDSVSINGIGCYIADFISHTVSFSISFSVKGRWK